MIEIELNGEPRTVGAGQSVRDLIAALELAGKGVAVAVNQEVVPRHEWEQRVLRAQDKVDVVRAIGGG